MGQFPLMDGGFPNRLQTEQYGFARALQDYGVTVPSNAVLVPKGPMWWHTDPAYTDEETYVGTTSQGLVFDQEFSGIVAVDDEWDEESEFDAVGDGTDPALGSDFRN